MTDTKLHEEIFDLIYARKNPEVAILRLNRALEKSPENSEALALKAYALNKLANTRKEWKYSDIALTSADKALSLNPNDDIALTSKGWALIDLGKAVDAIPFLIRATHVNPHNEYAWYNLAWAQYLTGKAAESAASITRALEISPNNAIVKRGKQMMKVGRLPTHLKRSPSLK